MNVFGCDFISSDPLSINSSAIQSRRIKLSPEPKISKSSHGARRTIDLKLATCRKTGILAVFTINSEVIVSMWFRSGSVLVPFRFRCFQIQIAP